MRPPFSITAAKLALALVLLPLFSARSWAGAAAPAPATTTSAGALGLAKIIAVVDGYLGAAQQHDWPRAYEFLSSASKQTMTKEAWVRSGGLLPATSAPEAAGWALLPGAESCKVNGISVAGCEGRAALEATYLLPSQLLLVKEGEEWKVDLPATDRVALSLAAATFSDALTRSAASSPLPDDYRILLQPFITAHRIDQVEVEGDRAKAKITETALVSAVLKLQRAGPCWVIAQPAAPAPAAAPAVPQPAQQPQQPQQWLPAPRNWRR